ncbi:MAG: acetyl esterase [Pseudonocardiales bacterium]|jgi:acetyl esterase/lipase|nr:acetyl esterase [Pseudonocardiales bacterium]
MNVGLNHLIDDGLAAHVDESRAFVAASAASASSRPPPDPSTPDGLRAARNQLASRPAPAGRLVTEQVAEAGTRHVPVRIIRPQEREPRAVYLEIHGGGFYLSSAARSDARNARLADAVGVAVVSVDYRLAPEHPWPAAPDDCETAATWLLQHAEPMFGTARLAIGGASAGANLAVTTLLRLRDKGLVAPFVGAALQFGAYDLSGQSPGGRAIADEFFIKAYAGNVADRTNPDISPLFGDLAGLPPSLLVVGTTDILLEDNLAMAARLSSAGAEVDVRVYPESPHGFTSFPTAMAEAAMTRIEAWLDDRLNEK